MALGRCWLLKESSQFDETIENSVIWRMPIFMLIERKEDHKVAMRQMTRFSMVSQDDSLGSKHLQSDI